MGNHCIKFKLSFVSAQKGPPRACQAVANATSLMIPACCRRFLAFIPLKDTMTLENLTSITASAMIWQTSFLLLTTHVSVLAKRSRIQPAHKASADK